MVKSPSQNLDDHWRKKMIKIHLVEIKIHILAEVNENFFFIDVKNVMT